MDEHDFDALQAWKPFNGNDVKNAERLPALGLALWGRTGEDLRQQLLAPTPKVPRGCTLADLERLKKQVMLMRRSPATFHKLHAEMIVVGDRTLSPLDARCEVVRRAIRNFREH